MTRRMILISSTLLDNFQLQQGAIEDLVGVCKNNNNKLISISALLTYDPASCALTDLDRTWTIESNVVSLHPPTYFSFSCY